MTISCTTWWAPAGRHTVNGDQGAPVPGTCFHATPPGAPRSLVVPDPHALNGLTPRQRVVLELIAQGYSTQDIARRLARSVKTVETHRAQLMKRLNIHHVPGLVAFAIRAGVVTIA